MLSKLLKYDLKWCFKPLIVFYIIGIFFSIIVRIIESVPQNLMLVIIDKICSGTVIAIMVSILINCFMRNWARFISNVYKDESYLTHTLPVSKNKIFLSKVLTSIITLFISFIVIIICMTICVLNANTWDILKSSLEASAIYFNSSVFSLVFVMIITIFFEFLFILMCGVLGIVIGHKSNNLKIVKSILIGFGIYMALSSLSVGAIFVIGLLNPDLMTLFKEITVSSNTLKWLMLVGISVYAIYNIGIYVVGNKLLNDGVNVD